MQFNQFRFETLYKLNFIFFHKKLKNKKKEEAGTNLILLLGLDI